MTPAPVVFPARSDRSLARPPLMFTSSLRMKYAPETSSTTAGKRPRRETTMETETNTEGVARLYRKECNGSSRKPTKATLVAVDKELALSRVRRHDLESFIRSGAFHKLTPLPAHVIKNAALRRRDYQTPEYCYTLTEGDLGRAKANLGTQTMSARIWLIRYYADTGAIETEEIAIVMDPK